jgi:hypothetical protein
MMSAPATAIEPRVMTQRTDRLVYTWEVAVSRLPDGTGRTSGTSGTVSLPRFQTRSDMPPNQSQQSRDSSKQGIMINAEMRCRCTRQGNRGVRIARSRGSAPICTPSRVSSTQLARFAPRAARQARSLGRGSNKAHSARHRCKAALRICAGG